jgi:hypothetical protein
MTYFKNDIALKALRPSLSLSSALSSDEESFQNEVIRPIVKMQHDLILSLIESYPHFINVLSTRENYQKLRESLTAYINNNPSIKNQLIGLVIGMMSTSELSQYIYDTQAVNKRIINIIAKRIADTLSTEIKTF